MKKFLKRGLAVVLSVAMIVGLLPVITDPVTVRAASVTKNINLNVDGAIAGISDPSVPASAASVWSGTYVYFGNDKYRVLDAATTDFSADGTTKTMFLDCDSVLEMRRYDDNTSDWQTSELREYLNNDFLSNYYMTGEQAAIASSTEGNGDHGSWSENDLSTVYQPLSGEKIFLLDLRESEHAAYGYSSEIYSVENNKIKAMENTASAWWIRTKYDDSLSIAIDPSNGIYGPTPTDTMGVSPALNVNLSSVLFASAAGSAKASSLLATTASSTKEWNLTLAGGSGLAATRKSGETGSVGLGKTMTVDVSSLGTASSGVAYTQLSAMLVGSDGTIAAYGKIADIVGGVVTGSNVTGSEVTVTIPSDVAVGNYSLKVFAEDVNSSASSNATDYASNMANISVTLASASTEIPSVGKIDESSYQSCDGTITGVSDTMEYKVSTQESYTPVPDGTVEITDLAPGTYQIRYQATDTVLAGTDAEVTIAAKNPELLSIIQPTAITGIANGTPLAGETDSIQAALPSTVAITTQDADITTATVTWDISGVTGYDPSKLTEQTFTVNGTVTLPSDVDNSSNVVLNTSISVTVMEGHIVATVTAADNTVTSYSDFISALSAAQSSTGSTLKLLDDVTYSSDTDVIAIASKMTLDLNGCTLQLNGTRGYIRLNAPDADFTVQDGKTDGDGRISSSSDYAIVVSEGKLTITGGIYETTVGAACTLQVDGDNASVYVSGGEFKHDANGVAFNVSNGNVILSGGSFSQIYRTAGSVEKLLADGYAYYDSYGIINTKNQYGFINVTVQEIDWSKAVTYDADQMTYTVLSADGLRWISGVTNNTVAEDTYQNDPVLPTATNFNNCTVRLGKDIDLSGKDWTPIGGAYIAAGEGGFAGIFDGAGHKITNMKVSISSLTGSTDIDAGFFTDIYGTVKNLSVSGSITIVGESDRIYYVGGIAGYATSAKLENCASHVDIALTATSGTCNVGGLIGSTNIAIANCISSGTRTISGGVKSITGGLIADYFEGIGLTNCYYAGTGDAIGNGSTTAWTSYGTYDAAGSLTAATDNTLSYGSNLQTALNTWVARKGTDAVQYVTWSADDISALTTVYASGHTHHMGAWTKQADGSYTRTCTECGLTEVATTCVTLGDIETPYVTLEEAITAAKEEDGSTVKLLSNVNTEQTVEVEKGTFTIDLGGKTWASTATTGLILKGTSHVTLKDSVGKGLIQNVTGTEGSTIYIQSVFANIESGSYVNLGSGTALKIEGGDVKLLGGTFTKIQTNDTVGRLLESGYAFKSKNDNTWVSDVSGNTFYYVAVMSAPVHITTQLEDTVLSYGYSTAPVLSVTAQKADGITSDITYQWYKDNTILTGATNASYTAETGLEVGTYHYYCAVTCDGYTLISSTVVFTVNKQAGSIANKEAGVGYAADHTYTGSSITAPLATDFITNSGGTVNFTWYTGDTTTEENRLESEPVAAGTYTLKAEVEEMDHYTAASTTVKVTIGYLETDAVAVLSGTLGDNNWYTANVTVSAPDGYAIAISNGGDASWSSSLTVDTDRTGAYTYYLKQTGTSYITDAKTVIINRDSKVPVLRYVITSTESTLTDTTAEISFRSGETGSYYYSVEKSGTVPSVNDLVAGKAHDMVSGSNKISIAGLERNTEYTLYIAGKDQAGNPTGVVTAISFQTAKTSLAKTEVELDENSYVYNGTSQIPDVTVSVGGTTADADQYNISYSNSSTGSDNTTDAGTITVTVTAKEDNENTAYDYTGTATASYVIAKKAVTVTAANATKQYGQVNPTLTLQPLASGQLVGDDTIADLHITLSTTAGTASEAGNYWITGTGSNANYEVTVNAGTLTITKIDAALTVPATAITKTYGDKDFSLGATTAGTAALSYQSSSTAVATVNSAGTVTIKGCGVTTITVTAAGTSYNSVAKTITLTVNPKTMGTPSLKSTAAKKLTVTWKKDSAVSGYEIAYSTSSKFTAKTTKTVTVKSYKTLTKAISKLKSGKKYYVHIRSYKSSGNTTIYGGWSKTAKIKVK